MKTTTLKKLTIKTKKLNLEQVRILESKGYFLTIYITN